MKIKNDFHSERYLYLFKSARMHEYESKKPTMAHSHRVRPTKQANCYKIIIEREPDGNDLKVKIWHDFNSKFSNDHYVQV